MATPTLDQIVAHGNRGHRSIENNWITCADGTELSVVAGGGTYSSPRPVFCYCQAAATVPNWPYRFTTPHAPMPHEVDHSYPGPYTEVEVMWPGEDVEGWVPVEKVREYIEAHGGEAVL